MTAVKEAIQSGREYEFSARDFEQVRKLIYERVGISLSDSKQDMVYSRLARRLRATGLRSFKDYLEILKEDNSEEWEAFVNSLTTNLTSFFREEHHFPLLTEHIKERRKNHQDIRIWCCAASTGEEPYSIAITVARAFNSLRPPVHILATDVDTNVLTTAQQGIYPLERLKGLPKDILKEFFLKGTGRHAGSARVRPELRNMITFRPLNLLESGWPIKGPFDTLFCRNVMIYFDKPTQYKIIKKFTPFMTPDALFFAGHSESFQHAADLITLRQKTVYELTK